MIHVSLHDRHEPHTYSFAHDEVVIGSAPDADLVLELEGVAPHHLKVVTREGELVIEDLRTAGRRHPPTALRAGDQVRLAGIELRIAVREVALAPSVEPVEERLLTAIRERPADPEVRAVYADWLEGQGQAARAEFLRAQLELGAATSAKDRAFAATAARLAELGPEVGAAWRARVSMAFIERCPSNRVDQTSWMAAYASEELGFELVCPMRWDRLEPTEREDIRSCSACQRHVTYCTTIEQARTLAMSGACVAVDVTNRRARLDLETQVRMVGRPSPPFSRFGRRAPAPTD